MVGSTPLFAALAGPVWGWGFFAASGEEVPSFLGSAGGSTLLELVFKMAPSLLQAGLFSGVRICRYTTKHLTLPHQTWYVYILKQLWRIRTRSSYQLELTLRHSLMLILLSSPEFLRAKSWSKVMSGAESRDFSGMVRSPRDSLGFFLSKICHEN